MKLDSAIGMELPGMPALPSNIEIALAIGVGTSFVYALVNVVPVILEGAGPGTIFAPGCPMSIYHAFSVQGLFFVLFHILWTIMGFLAYEKRSVLQTIMLLCWHFAASAVTALNKDINCDIAFGCLAAIFVLNVVFSILLMKRKPVFSKLSQDEDQHKLMDDVSN